MGGVLCFGMISKLLKLANSEITEANFWLYAYIACFFYIN
jgi:hypothetical protein